MKKILTILCAVLCIFGLVACNPAPEQEKQETGPLTVKDFARIEKATKKASAELSNAYSETMNGTASFDDGKVITANSVNLHYSGDSSSTTTWNGHTLKEEEKDGKLSVYWDNVKFDYSKPDAYPESYKEYRAWNKKVDKDEVKISKSNVHIEVTSANATFTSDEIVDGKTTTTTASYKSNRFSYKISMTVERDADNKPVIKAASIDDRPLSSDQLKDDKLVSLIVNATEIMMH